ncbi:hypothetical protein PFDG_05235, partial [Plasmodium falciparum Dd2]
THEKNEGVLASCSWSIIVLLWYLYPRPHKGSKHEETTTSHDISYLCSAPRGKDKLAACTSSCKIMFWDTSIQDVVVAIGGARDIKRGRFLGAPFGGPT